MNYLLVHFPSGLVEDVSDLTLLRISGIYQEEKYHYRAFFVQLFRQAPLFWQ